MSTLSLSYLTYCAILREVPDDPGGINVDDDFVTMREAAEILGVSKFTMWRLVRDGELAAYRSGSDKREKLVKRADVEAYKAPKPIAIDEPKKDAPRAA